MSSIHPWLLGPLLSMEAVYSIIEANIGDDRQEETGMEFVMVIDCLSCQYDDTTPSQH